MQLYAALRTRRLYLMTAHQALPAEGRRYHDRATYVIVRNGTAEYTRHRTGNRGRHTAAAGAARVERLFGKTLTPISATACTTHYN